MLIKELIKKTVTECSNIVFPNICIHCQEKTAQNNFFCDACLENFEILSKIDAIRYIGSAYPMIATFDNIGPAATLLFKISNYGAPALVKLAASFMTFQYLNLSLEMPDAVSFIPTEGLGFRYNEILAKEIGKILKRPIKKLFFQTNIAIWTNSLGLKKTEMHRKKLLVITAKITEEKIKQAQEKLSKKGFSDFSFLGLCF